MTNTTRENITGAEPATRRLSTRTLVLWIALATVLGGALRIHNLGAWSMWIDEVHSVTGALRLLNQQYGPRLLAFVPTLVGLLLQGVEVGSLDPLAYHTWREAGVTEWSVRLPAAVIGIITIPWLAWGSRHMIGVRGAAVLALLLAASTWHLWMSQAGRFYAQQFLFYNVALLAWYQATRPEIPEKRKLWLLISTAGFVALAFMSQLTSLMILGIFVADWIVQRLQGYKIRLGVGGWLAAGVAMGLCAIPVIYDMMTRPQAYTHFQGGPQGLREIVWGVPYMIGISIVLMAAATVVMLMRHQTRLIVYLTLAAVLPIVTIGALNLLGSDVHVRYVFIALFAWLALASLGVVTLFEVLRPRLGIAAGAVPAALLLVSSAMTSFGYQTTGHGYRERWDMAFNYIAEHRMEHEKVASEGNGPILAAYYLAIPFDEIVRFRQQSTSELLKNRAPVWIAVFSKSPTQGRRFAWLDKHATLRAYFSTHVLQPHSVVNVYYLGTAEQ